MIRLNKKTAVNHRQLLIFKHNLHINHRVQTGRTDNPLNRGKLITSLISEDNPKHHAKHVASSEFDQ